MSEVQVLRGWGRDAAVRRKWLKLWEKVGARVLMLPEWLQEIVLEDVNTAIENRLSVMEMIVKSRKSDQVA
jgi:hypothetical protein